jgi:tetratricopeptide (TPR) repeat protein
MSGPRISQAAGLPIVGSGARATPPPHSVSFFTILLTVILTLVPQAFSEQNQPAVNDWLLQAKQAELAGDFPRAAECYTSFLKNHSDRPDIWQRLGLAYYLGKQYDKASPALERASELDPTLWGADLFLGISEYRLGSFGKAQRALENALKAKPDMPESRFWLGCTLMALGKHEQATVELEKVPTGSSVAMDANYLLAQGYRRVAESYYGQMQKNNASSYRAHQLAAEAFAWAGRYQNAILEYRKALELKPEVEGAHRGIAEMYWGQRQFERAAQEYEAELRYYPLDDQARLRMGEYRLVHGEVRKAVAELEAALRVNKTSWEACRALGQAWMASGDVTKAQLLLEAAVQNNPSDAFSHRLLAEVYRAISRSDLAEREEGIFHRLS